MIPSTSHPDSVPFLLVRQAMSDDVDDVDTAEIPASKSVPPHAPPAAVVSMENELPSVIVDLRELELNAELEAERASDVDVLLAAKLDFPIPELPLTFIPCAPDTQPSLRSEERAAPRARGFAIALLAAVTAAGVTFAGLRVCHVSTGSLGAAAIHLVR